LLNIFIQIGGHRVSNAVIQEQMNDVKLFLENTVLDLSAYINHHSLEKILEEEGSRDVDYYEKLLRQLRRLEVFCLEALEAVSIQLNSKQFREKVAEQTLYRIYHKCILEFFSPKDDIWYEDSRALYTGKKSICFQADPPKSVKQLISSLETSFHRIREELEYYETDYQTKLMSNR
jgi:hypothetical protein